MFAVGVNVAPTEVVLVEVVAQPLNVFPVFDNPLAVCDVPAPPINVMALVEELCTSVVLVGVPVPVLAL